MSELFGSIEAGGTKFVCAVGDSNLEVVDKTQFPTTTPDETIAKTIEYFKNFEGDLKGVSLASFGPLDLNKESKTYGYITTTTKVQWRNADVLGMTKAGLNVPVYLTTDVNASAYGEYIVRDNVKNLVYYTIGTGIGAGIVQDGNIYNGISNPEAGHTHMQFHNLDIKNNFEGVCPYHKGCFEGMAAGPSLEARTGIKGEDIAPDSEVWDAQAFYIAQSAVQATLMYRPQVIVYGGGVMSQEHMLNRVRKQFVELLNNYVEVPAVEDYIVTPIVPGNGSATVGNFALAKTL